MNKFVIVLLAVSGALNGQPIKTPQHVFSGINDNMAHHKGDDPFPTDMTFSCHADHRILPTTAYFDPEVVKKGDTIFLMDWYIPWFTKYVHPKIQDPYILISCDSDEQHPDRGIWDYDEKWGWRPPVEATRTLLYDSKVAAWFCKNMLLSRHPKITQIPIGQNIIYWGNFQTELPLNLAKMAPFNKKYLLYMNIQQASHASRPGIVHLFENKDYCLNRVHRIPIAQFYEELSQSQFTVAPRGYGIDTARFWEALVLDCIPIVKHSELDDLYADLPVLFVHSWSRINKKFLEEKYQEISKRNYSTEKAYFPYWGNKIAEAQQQVKMGKNSFSKLEATKFSKQILDNLIQVLKKSNVRKAQLYCKGSVMGLRPFQIAELCPFLSKLYVHDEWGAWGHEVPQAHLRKFTDDPILKQASKLTPVNYWTEPDYKKVTHFFFDLTYRRHTLPDDLQSTYPHMLINTILCGNLSHDVYVQEVLKQFEEANHVTFRYIGDIWYLVKK